MNLKIPKQSMAGKTILKVAKRRPLSDFFGVLSKESSDKLEKAVLELQKKRINPIEKE